MWVEHPEKKTTSRGSPKYSEISYGYLCNVLFLYQHFQWNGSHFGNSTAFPQTFPGKKMKLFAGIFYLHEKHSAFNKLVQRRYPTSTVQLTWSPIDKRVVSPVGSIKTSTLKAVTLSDGGQASITPPENQKIVLLMSLHFSQWHMDQEQTNFY